MPASELVAAERSHEARARQCRADAAAVEKAQLMAEESRWALALEEVVATWLEVHASFKDWESGAKRAWSSNTALYSRQVHLGIARTANLHAEAARVLVYQCDMAAGRDLEIHRSAALRQAYAAIVALEMLVHGPLPDHAWALAKAARRDYEAGNTEEIES